VGNRRSENGAFGRILTIHQVDFNIAAELGVLAGLGHHVFEMVADRFNADGMVDIPQISIERFLPVPTWR